MQQKSMQMVTLRESNVHIRAAAVLPFSGWGQMPWMQHWWSWRPSLPPFPVYSSEMESAVVRGHGGELQGTGSQ